MFHHLHEKRIYAGRVRIWERESKERDRGKGGGEEKTTIITSKKREAAVRSSTLEPLPRSTKRGMKKGEKAYFRLSKKKDV